MSDIYFPWNDCMETACKTEDPNLAMTIVFGLNAIFDLIDERFPKNNTNTVESLRQMSADLAPENEITCPKCGSDDVHIQQHPAGPAPISDPDGGPSTLRCHNCDYEETS